MPQRLHDFLEPFKMGMKHFKSGEEPDEVFGVVPVLFLWDGPVSPEQLRAFQGQPQSYLLQVPPLNPSSLVMSNPGQAMRICFLTDYRLASAASEPELIDSGVIFAQRFIRQRFPEAARKYVCELVENDNIHYLDDRHSEGGSVLISTEPVFSEGAVFSSSLSTNTLAMSFYNKDVLPLVGALLSTRLTNFKGRSSVGEVQLLQMEVPSYLQNKPYQELFQALMRGRKHTGKGQKRHFGDMLPLGLYRRHDGINEPYWYAFTNPSPDTVVRSEDRIFYLKRTRPWTP